MNLVTVARARYGRGLFARKDISKGALIMKLKGPRISYAQLLRLKKPDNPFQVGLNRYVNLDKPGVFANHSCRPNSGVTPELELIALRAIKAQEEIVYDYSTSMDADTECGFTCSCGSSDCRETIGGFATLPRRKQVSYLRRGIVQRFLLDEQRRLSAAEGDTV